MSAIETNASGDYVFMALENASGFPLVVKSSRDGLSTFEIVWNPGTGSACNIAQVPGNDDLMLFYGNFGSSIVVILHTISTGGNTDISPSGLTTKIVNTLAVNPSNSDEIIISIGTDQDLKSTSDGGATWEDLNTALGYDPTALLVLWSGAYELHRYFIAGNDTLDTFLHYSPNEGSSSVEMSDASLNAQANIIGLDYAD